MNKQKLVFCLLLAFAMAAGLAGQEADPVVTGLVGELKNNLLRLTWQDAPDAKGPVYIYRSPISYDAAANSIPQIIPYGIESYIDEFDETGSYYYFIAASDERGQRFNRRILPDNSMLVYVTVTIAPDAVPASDSSVISGIKTELSEDFVIISFNLTAAYTNLVLYRSIRPIRDTHDLLGAAIIHSNTISPFFDIPVPGIPYYYAVIPEYELTMGRVTIYPGVNSTIDPVEVAAERTGTGTRTVPLPLITLSTAAPNMLSLNETPLPDNLSPDAARALGNIPSYGRSNPPVKSSRVLEEEFNTSGGGEEYLLAAIIQGVFINREWEQCRDELNRFIAVPRRRLTEARARFYLGQCLYFLNEPREALFEFLEARSQYPEETAEWIQAVLQMMVE